jgi:5-formyltetrahydrofolate cyclo-ligase
MIHSEDKQKMRERIWKTLEDKELLNTTKTCYGRIPNFKGAEEAAQMLRGTKKWKDSKIIFSSPDSAQTRVREYALRDGKLLIMASPKLKKGYLLVDPENCPGHEQLASTIQGAFKYGKTLKKFPAVDLVVEGSVAVDLSGKRLGKGGGYGDQEISHLLREKSINGDTLLVTTVHEIQIVKEVPTESHDKKINMIVTSRDVIEIKDMDV